MFGSVVIPAGQSAVLALLDLPDHRVGDGGPFRQLSQFFEHSRHVLALLLCRGAGPDFGQGGLQCLIRFVADYGSGCFTVPLNDDVDAALTGEIKPFIFVIQNIYHGFLDTNIAYAI